MKNNIYYINVDVRLEDYYSSIVYISSSIPDIWKELGGKYYKVKVKNEKYVDDYLETGIWFKVYASNLIYLEEC
jgi:hypothetical protein